MLNTSPICYHMKNPSLSKKVSLILLGLLTILLRYPTTPAPTGTDNFYYISMAQTILIDGEISWAKNILSLYGLFPGTSPLGATLMVTTICSITGLSVIEYTFIHGFVYNTGIPKNQTNTVFGLACYSHESDNTRWHMGDSLGTWISCTQYQTI